MSKKFNQTLGTHFYLFHLELKDYLYNQLMPFELAPFNDIFYIINKIHPRLIKRSRRFRERTIIRRDFLCMAILTVRNTQIEEVAC